MENSDIIFFYFPKESVCPIALYELGRMISYYRLELDRVVIVGCDEDYSRKNDLDIQIELATHGDLVVHRGLDSTVANLQSLLGKYAEHDLERTTSHTSMSL